VLLLIITNSAFSQNSVEYDFKTKSLDTIKSVRIGENCVFKVNNINKFIYEVKIKSSQSEFCSKPPAILSGMLKIETPEKNTIESEIKKVNDQVYADTIINKLIDCKNRIDELSKEIDSLNKDSTNNKDTIIIRQKEKESIEKIKSSIERDTIYVNVNYYYKKLAFMQSKSIKISSLFDKLEKVKEIKNKLIRISVIDGMNYDTVKSKIDILYKEYPYIKNPEDLLSEFYKVYKQLVVVNRKYEDDRSYKKINLSDSIKISNSIERLSEEIDNLYNKVAAYNYSLLFQEIDLWCNELVNSNNYFVASDPIQASGDIINYNLIINPKESSNPVFVSEKRDFNVEVPIYGGMKIDFSTGFFVTNNLYNRTYSISNYLADSSMKVISQDKNNSLAQFSVGALMHISPRCKGYIKPGFAFGLGLNSADLTKVQVYIGASAIFGLKEQFIISAGLSLANVDYLKGKYSLGTPTINLNDDTPLTEKVIRAGWFISFTYNLTSKKKEQ